MNILVKSYFPWWPVCKQLCVFRSNIFQFLIILFCFMTKRRNFPLGWIRIIKYAICLFHNIRIYTNEGTWRYKGIFVSIELRLDNWSSFAPFLIRDWDAWIIITFIFWCPSIEDRSIPLRNLDSFMVLCFLSWNFVLIRIQSILK